MRVSIRRTFGDPPEVHDLAWSQVCDLYRSSQRVPFRGNTRTEKPVDLPLIAFCAFTEHDPKGPPGCRRRNMHPEGLWAIALDFDDADPGVFARILANAKSMSPRGLVHTTWKHGLTGSKLDALRTQAAGTEQCVRARIVMPILLRGLHSPLPASHWPAYWEAVVTAIGAREPGAGLDEQCHNPERLWYLPCTNLDAPTWAPWLEVWGMP